MPTRDEVAALFRLFDTDGNGFLSPAELKAIFCDPHGGNPRTEEEIDEVVKRFDKNNDGQLSVDELMDAWLHFGLDKAKPEDFVRTPLDDLVKKAQAAQSTASDDQDAGVRHSKFASSTFALAYAGLSTFHGGLEALIGPPNPNLRLAMRTEHCGSADSKFEFTTGNYGITTTPEIEWHVVLDPASGLKALKRTEYPTETHDCENKRGVTELKPIDDFLPALKEKNEKLKEMEEAELLKEELITGRLYTGPMVGGHA